jgi:hypothetical protein
MIKNFRQWLTVDEIAGQFVVVRRERWERDNPAAIASFAGVAVLADGPFGDRADAERAKDRIKAQAARAATR